MICNCCVLFSLHELVYAILYICDNVTSHRQRKEMRYGTGGTPVDFIIIIG